MFQDEPRMWFQQSNDEDIVIVEFDHRPLVIDLNSVQLRNRSTKILRLISMKQSSISSIYQSLNYQRYLFRSKFFFLALLGCIFSSIFFPNFNIVSASERQWKTVDIRDASLKVSEDWVLKTLSILSKRNSLNVFN